MTSDSVSSRVGRKVHLKLETLQKTGSFKIRGAYYKISKLRSSVNAKGVVAVSAHNHAQGVPLAALATLSRVIAAKGANILQIRRDRISKGIPVGCSRVVLELETAGFIISRRSSRH